ncbi:MAG: RNA chaperone Hfq [Pseudomonadota bacterium]
MVTGTDRGRPPEDKRHSLPGNTRVQDEFLRRIQERQSALAVRLVDGQVLRGTVKEFDQYSVLLLPNPPGPLQLIYKHAIATLGIEAEANPLASSSP